MDTQFPSKAKRLKGDIENGSVEKVSSNEIQRRMVIKFIPGGNEEVGRRDEKEGNGHEEGADLGEI